VHPTRQRAGAGAEGAGARRTLVGTVRPECLDRILILGRRHLEHVLASFALHYNEHRPHRSLAQRPSLGKLRANDERSAANVIDLDRVRRRELLGGLIHEYRLAA
jgi:putative transposase